MAPNCRNSDAIIQIWQREKLKSDSFKWKHEISPLNNKKLYADATKIYGRKKSSIHEIVMKEKQILASVAVAPQTAEIIATQCMLIA